MPLQDVLLLIVAGLAGGTISALVGGAALVTFPALLATGLAPIPAAAANLVALAPGNLLAALSDRSQLPPLDRSFIGLVLASLIGAAIGASLLLVTPERVFALLVPLLLGFATILFAVSPQVSAWLRARAAARGHTGPYRWGNSIAALLPVSVYGGYFGAGVGVLLVAVLSIATAGDYRRANATKNLVTAFNGLAAIMVFAARGGIDWPATGAMMSGALLGSLVGARIARHAPRELMRFVVVAIGALLTIVYAWRYWF